MNATVQLYFGAPVAVVRSWIERHGLMEHLSRRERSILGKPDAELTEQELVDLFWYIEALWAFAWVGSLIRDIPLDAPVGDELASLLPDLKADETPRRFREAFRLRDPADLYRKLDLYYLAHWYARDGQLRNYKTDPFNIDSIMERRKALEWVLDETIPDWDETPAST